MSYPPYINSVGADPIDRALERIAKALNDDAASFLFGAGMSVPSGLPTGSQLIAKLLRRFFPMSGTNPPSEERLKELASEFPFETIVEALEKNLGAGRDDLTDELRMLLLDEKYEKSQAHEDFLSVCFWGGRLRLDAVFTTNFDLLIEQTLGDSIAETLVESDAKKLRQIRGTGRLPILHLHGVLSNEYEITETDLYKSRFRALTTEFQTALQYNDAFVFVGYSMNDPDFRNIYLKYREEIINRGKVDKKTYVVSPARDEYSYRLGKEVWRQRGAEWIPLDAASFFAELKRVLESRFDKDTKDKVKRKYALVDDMALGELVNRVAEALRVEPSEALEFLSEARTRGGAG